MSSEVAVSAVALRKAFRSYKKPYHRLGELLMPDIGLRWGSEFVALHDIDVEIHRGETVGILGVNGSGKSTLLQILCGIMQPSSGQVRVEGRIAALLELGAGFNPQFTGRENVRLYGSVLGLSAREIEDRLPAILEFADIGHFIDEPVKHYSSGMFVRLAFATAIHVDPDILVVDEALSVGDEAFQRKCFSRIEEIKRMGATILFVSHSAPTILQLCDRAVVLHQGQRIYTGKPNSAVAIYQRILYSPRERVPALIEEARQYELTGVEVDFNNQAVAADAMPDEGIEADSFCMESEPQAEPISLERFDPGMVSLSRFEFESHGARIVDPQICNSRDEIVNVLEHGGNYVYQFEVFFERPVAHVHFGMLIKSISGVELAGASSHRFDESMSDVAAGTRILVKFHWRCDLLPGMYFLNAGCNGVPGPGQAETFLHRIVDAYAFRVEVKDRPRRSAGFFNILTSPYVTLATEESM